MQIQLGGKVALVTGGGTGIGRGIVLALARAGADVAIHYHTNRQGASQTLSEVEALGVRGMLVQADATRLDEVRAMVADVTAHLGQITILVNNAGGLVGRVKVGELTEEHYQKVMDVNLKSAVFVSQAVMDSIRGAGWGRIINMSSIAAHTGGSAGSAIYAASKAAVIAFTRALAKELAPIATVNAVSPGLIGDTPFHATFTTPENYRATRSAIPMGREGFPPDVAAAVCFLASEQAGWITGETLEINGGALMR
ncbi:MAG: SDR family NAD(P)-dependent oxidoreductase [Bacillota bacterium]